VLDSTILRTVLVHPPLVDFAEDVLGLWELGSGMPMIESVEQLVVTIVVTFAVTVLRRDLCTLELGLMVSQLVITDVVEPSEHNEHGRVFVVSLHMVVALRHGAAVTGRGSNALVNG